MPKTRRIPQRQCVSCGALRAKRELVRVVRTPDGTVRLDRTGKLSGRGAYVCADAACVDRALREDRLARALQQAIPQEITGLLLAAPDRPAPPRAPVVRRIMLPRLEDAGRPARAGGRHRKHTGGMS